MPVELKTYHDTIRYANSNVRSKTDNSQFNRPHDKSLLTCSHRRRGQDITVLSAAWTSHNTITRSSSNYIQTSICPAKLWTSAEWHTVLFVCFLFLFTLSWMSSLRWKLHSLLWFSQRRSPTPHFGGCAPRGLLTPNSNSAEIFVQCTYPTFYHPMFTR